MKFFLAGVDFTDPMKSRVQFDVKLEKSKKSESSGILKFKMWSRNILENMLQKKMLLQKCHVRVILHFVSGSEGYLWEKAIIQILEWFAGFHSSLWEVILTWYQKHLFFGDIILVWKKTGGQIESMGYNWGFWLYSIWIILSFIRMVQYLL